MPNVVKKYTTNIFDDLMYPKKNNKMYLLNVLSPRCSLWSCFLGLYIGGSGGKALSKIVHSVL